MSAPDPRTYNDYIQTLVYHLGGANDERNSTIVRAAIRQAYRNIALTRVWNYLWKKSRLELNAPYTTGTIQYVNSTRLLTLTGGTFPSWTGNGYASLRINNVVSRIPAQTVGGSGTTATLDVNNNPQVDVAAGTVYSLYQSLYPLPSDFRNMERPVPESNWWFGEYMDPEDWMILERQGVGGGSSGYPTRWTVLGDDQVMGGRMVAVWPYPTTAGTYDLMYQRLPQPIARTGTVAADNQGTVTATAASTTVTGTGTAFSSLHVGSVIRFSSDTTKFPTGRDGTNPYQEQQTVASVQSATQLTTAVALSSSYTGTKYVLSDPIDFAEHMLTAFERGCELEIARKKERGDVNNAEAAYTIALRRAFEADVPVSIPRFQDPGHATPIRPTLRIFPIAPYASA